MSLFFALYLNKYYSVCQIKDHPIFSYSMNLLFWFAGCLTLLLIITKFIILPIKNHYKIEGHYKKENDKLKEKSTNEIKELRDKLNSIQGKMECIISNFWTYINNQLKTIGNLEEIITRDSTLDNTGLHNYIIDENNKNLEMYKTKAIGIENRFKN